MQVTITRPLAIRTVATLAATGLLAIVAVSLLAVAGAIPGLRQSTSAPMAISQASADAAYTTESELAYANMLRAQTSGRQMTSDTAYAVEADQLARQHAAQAERLFLTSDEAYASEQALMTEQSQHLARQRGDHIPPRLRTH